MLSGKYCVSSLVLVLACAMAGLSAWSETPAAAKPEVKAEDVQKASATGEAESDEPYQNRWILCTGGSNYYPRLQKSEGQIEAQLNNGIGRFIPGWRRPQSFKAWRDAGMLWDISFGVGRDISPKLTWMVWTGGAYGLIKSQHGYGPIGTDIRFSRTTTFLTLQGYYHFLGKPSVVRGEEDCFWTKVGDSLKNTKPYLSLATGYSFIRAGASAKFSGFGAKVFKKTQVDYDHMAQVSPRLGVEIPLGKNTSFTTEGTYYFFFPTRHTTEYNGPSFSMEYKYMF